MRIPNTVNATSGEARMTGGGRSAQAWLLVILGLHLALGLLYDWATPIFEAPDEGYHFAVIRWIAHGNGLPVQDPDRPQDWAQEGNQPPLYHALAAGLVSGIDTNDWEQTFVLNPFSRIGIPGTSHNVNLFRHTPDERFPYHGLPLAVHLVRWFSLLLSAGTILLTYHLALAMFPTHVEVALLAAALTAFNPKALFINAAVNNDNLLMLLSTATLLALVAFMRPSVNASASKLVGVGFLLGLAALTKVSGLVLWPVAALALAWRAWQTRDVRALMLNGVVVFGVALAVSGWWFWRNYALYREWLGLNTMIAIAQPRSIALLDLLREEWYGFYRSYWDVFGVFTILSADWVHWLFDGLTLWALAGLAWGLIRRRAWPRPEAWLLALFCLLTLIGVIRWTLQTPASQGRLMFGAIAPLSSFMAYGLLAPLKRRPIESWILKLIIFGLTLVAAVIPLAYIAPRYAPPRLLAEADVPGNVRPVQAVFGESMELIGYWADDEPRAPGQVQAVTLYWRVLRPMARDYALALHLFGRGQASEVGKIDTWPGGGLAPTSQLSPGAIFVDTSLIPITTEAETPSLLWLSVDVWDGQPESTLPMTTPNGPAEALSLPVGRLVPAQPLTRRPSISVNSSFEYGLTLLGLDSGADGAFTLYWQTEQSVPGDYTVFAHLLDSGGVQVTQKDSPPLGGDWPTWAWVPGQAFAEVRQFDVPADLRLGQYTLRLGFYDPVTGVRLAAFRPDGAQWLDNAVVIENVIEIK